MNVVDPLRVAVGTALLLAVLFYVFVGPLPGSEGIVSWAREKVTGAEAWNEKTSISHRLIATGDYAMPNATPNVLVTENSS